MSKKVLVKNFSSLFFIQIANYILPFLVIPYIVRIVGVEKFGIITFAYVIIGYFNLLIDYGFKLIITRDIAKNKNSLKKQSLLFWQMYFSQLILLFFSVIIFLVIINFFDIFSKYKEVYEYAFLMVIGNFLFPIWFFQGIEKMEMIAFFDIIGRVLYVILVFLFVKSESDFILVPFFNGLSMILIGIVSLFFIFKKFNLMFYIPTFKRIISFYKEGWHLFISNIAVNLYTNFNTFILGVLSGYMAVGIYSLAEKIFGAIMKIVGIINVIYFPHLSSIKEKIQLIKKIRFLIKLELIGFLFLSLILFFSANFMIKILFGDGHEQSIVVLKILSFVILLRPFGQLFTNYLIIKKQNYLVSKITLYTTLFNLIIAIPLIYFYSFIGLAITVLIVQVFQVLLNLYFNKEIIR